MRENLVDRLRIIGARRALRAKLQRAMDEIIEPRHVEVLAELQRLREEIDSLSGRLDELADGRRQLGEEVQSAANLVVDRIVDQVRGFEVRSRRDLVYAAEVKAASESAEYVRRHLAGARQFPQPLATLEYALSLAPSGGMALEFGVYTGSTLRTIAEARDGEQVFGFDSFDGLPEDWRVGFAAGTFAVDKPPDVPGAQIIPGMFEEVLPGFLETHPGPVDFLHVDSDLYSSARIVLGLVGPRLRDGSVVVFDEFFNYPGWQDHEHRAWFEFVDQSGIDFRYQAFTYDNEQVVVTVGADARQPTTADDEPMTIGRISRRGAG